MSFNTAVIPALGGFEGASLGSIEALANQMTTAAQGFSNSLTAQAAALAAPVINPNFPLVVNAPIPATTTAPTLQQVTWNVPVEPAPISASLGNLLNYLPGPFTGIAPVLNFPTAPAAFSTTEPAPPAVNLAFTYPSLSITLPTPPSLLSLTSLSFNPFTIPTFNASVPALTAAAPAPFYYVEGTMYTSDLLSQVEVDLKAAIALGVNLSLPNAAQQALMDAAYEREYRTQANALAELVRMAELGYAFPTGAFISARTQMQTELNNTMAGVSREIMATQYKTQLDNLVAARQQAVTLESKLVDYANNIAQRAFDAAKYITEAGIAIYNAQVESYKASLDGYRTMAMVYETQLKGIQAQIEQLTAQINFEKVKADINTALVEQYKSEVEAQNLLVAIYKAQLDAIQIQASVEKIKVDIFGSEIQAFLGQVNAYSAQISAYKSTAETQGVIESAYKTSVDAYTAEVQAGVAQINANVDVFKAQVTAYQAELAGYDSAIRGMVGQATAASQYNTAAADVYRAAVAAVTSYNGTLTAEWQAVMQEQLQITQIGVSAAKANGDLYETTRQLSIDASKVGAQVSAQIAAAALGAAHWSTSISAAVSASNSTSFLESQSASV